jgi:predicted DNA-binding transcriptional regulator AlpA
VKTTVPRTAPSAASPLSPPWLKPVPPSIASAPTREADPDGLLDPQNWLDAKAVAATLGISVGRLWNRLSADRGDLPAAYKFGRNLRFRKADVIAFLNDHKHARNVPAATHSANPAA